MAEIIKGYKKRIAKRRMLARKLGREGFYTSDAKYTYPKPLSVLLQMIESEGRDNG